MADEQKLPMKKCKYHCDYGDGEYCHYKEGNGCIYIKGRKLTDSESMGMMFDDPIEQRTPKVQTRPNVHVACGMMDSRTSKFD